ncbi:MAG: cytochrome P450 [Ilumatobacteraceae bacterium]|nr:cytochrome P450 [Ilumatobacteraceae bacterium]
MHSPSPQGTLGFLLHGYDYIGRECNRRDADAFRTRLLGVPVTCMRGAEAGRVFYDQNHFERAGVAPRRARRTLFGEGGVQGLDDHAHHHRKSMFLSLMSTAAVADLAERTRIGWNEATTRWERSEAPVVLYDEAGQLLCRAVFDWAGVPIDDDEVPHRTDQLHHLIDSAARIGPSHWRGRRARTQIDRWAEGLIGAVRNGTLHSSPERALHTIATHRDSDGRLLDRHVAAVELINILRPTVAIDRFIVFAAVALHSHPAWRERLRTDDDTVEWFVQEVRRTFSFFPFTAARVRQPFDWRGVHFPRGRLVLYDLYGTNHHDELWPKPDTFEPERFRHWDEDPFSLVPQGGGDHAHGHRCPGEWITIETMKVAVEILTRTIDYTVPPQDLRISHRNLPTLPNSRFVLNSVRRR